MAFTTEARRSQGERLQQGWLDIVINETIKRVPLRDLRASVVHLFSPASC